MAASPPLIGNVSDTARWVAVYRAQESDRPDPLFHDRFARALAGDQGQSIVSGLPGAETSGWAISVRTAVFDEMILRAIGTHGVDLVLNLAAGLDSLRWVEIDLPGIIEHKEKVLRDEKPVCQLSRRAVDLSDVTARRRAFAEITAGAKSVFVLTEGLLMYLSEPQVASLASDLSAVAPVRFWAADIIGPIMKWGLNLWWYRALSAGNSTFQFAPRIGAEFFKPFGWEILDYRAIEQETVRLNRLPLYARAWKYTHKLATPRMKDLSRRSAGFVLLENRAKPTP